MFRILINMRQLIALFLFVKLYIICILFEPRCEKTCLRGLRRIEIHTSLLSYRDMPAKEILLMASLDIIPSNTRII